MGVARVSWSRYRNLGLIGGNRCPVPQCIKPIPVRCIEGGIRFGIQYRLQPARSVIPVADQRSIRIDRLNGVVPPIKLLDFSQTAHENRQLLKKIGSLTCCRMDFKPRRSFGGFDVFFRTL